MLHVNSPCKGTYRANPELNSLSLGERFIHVGSENHWDHRIIECLLLIKCIYFKVLCRWIEMMLRSCFESHNYWVCCWRVASTSIACVYAAWGHFEHMLYYRWRDVTRVTFWEIITVTHICHYSFNHFWAHALSIMIVVV